MQSIFGISISVAALLLIGAITFVLFGRLTARDRMALTEQHQTIEVDGRSRKYRFYTPNPNKELPLVVMLHGYNYDSGRISELYSGWSNLAEQTGEFAVAYPEGIARSWNGGFCCGYAYNRGINDVEFISKLMAELDTSHKLSGARYIVGFSNGSFLAQRLLAEKPNLFDAGAAVMTGVGEKDGEQLNLANATAPLIIITGSRDSYTNHSLSRQGFRFTSADTTIDKWSKQLSVKPVNSNKNDAKKYEQTTYKSDRDKTKLIYRLYDESHRWPWWRLWMFKRSVSPFTADLWEQLQLLSQER